MGNPEGTSGRRLFIAGVVVLAVFSSLHMIPFVADIFVTPTDPAEIEMKRTMAAVKVDTGPFHTHYGLLFQLLGAGYSELLYFVVALNFVVLRPILAAGRLRALAMVNAIFSGVLFATAAAVQFPPPAVCSLVATVLFALAALRAPR